MPDKDCHRCDGQGWYWRTPSGFNPFLAGGFQTARAMYKVNCICDVHPPAGYDAARLNELSEN